MTWSLVSVVKSLPCNVKHLCSPKWIFELSKWVGGVSIWRNISIFWKWFWPEQQVLDLNNAALELDCDLLCCELEDVSSSTWKVQIVSRCDTAEWANIFIAELPLHHMVFQMSDTSENTAGWISRPPNTLGTFLPKKKCLRQIGNLKLVQF